MNVSLVMVTADGKVKELPSMHLPITIGRSEECKLRIPLASVSRKHCELSLDADELHIRDLKSSNGTFVNKDRVADRELIPGDLISVGPVVFVVKIDGFPKIVDPVISYANGAVGPEDLATSGAPATAGVPTWSGGSGGGSEATGALGGRKSDPPHVPVQASKSAPPAPSKPAPAKAAPAKPAPKKANEDSDGFESLLADLSESDFDDIDLGDDQPPKAKKA